MDEAQIKARIQEAERAVFVALGRLAECVNQSMGENGLNRYSIELGATFEEVAMKDVRADQTVTHLRVNNVGISLSLRGPGKTITLWSPQTSRGQIKR